MPKTTPASRSATHSGTCQCCGSRQKLPGGLLSLHGYERPDGWFEGICQGARHLPFEQDYSLVERFIQSAQAQIAGLPEAVAALRERRTPAKIEVMTGAYFKGSYVRTLVPVEITVEGGEVYVSYADPRKGAQHKPARHLGHYIPARATTDAEKIDAVYDLLAAPRLSSLISRQRQLQNYIEWQQGRVANWTPKPLIPVPTTAQVRAEKEEKVAAEKAAGPKLRKGELLTTVTPEQAEQVLEGLGKLAAVAWDAPEFKYTVHGEAESLGREIARTLKKAREAGAEQVHLIFKSQKHKIVQSLL